MKEKKEEKNPALIYTRTSRVDAAAFSSIKSSLSCQFRTQPSIYRLNLVIFIVYIQVLSGKEFHRHSTFNAFHCGERPNEMNLKRRRDGGHEVSGNQVFFFLPWLIISRICYLIWARFFLSSTKEGKEETCHASIPLKVWHTLFWKTMLESRKMMSHREAAGCLDRGIYSDSSRRAFHNQC